MPINIKKILMSMQQVEPLKDQRRSLEDALALVALQ
jgi:hypothetical protein